MDESLVGFQIGGCCLRRLIGAGGIGSVYEACHLASGRLVAVKVLGLEACLRSNLVERFEREARLAYGLEHPHLIRVYTWGRASGVPYMAMELVDGPTLDQLVGHKGALRWSVAAQLIASVSNALHHLHCQGVIHRDIKPGNILLSRRGAAKLADLGLARQISDAPDEVGGRRFTAPGASIGSPAFMAPEQVHDTSTVGIPADVYGLGSTLYHCLTGRLPFNASSTSGVLRKVLLDDPVPVEDLVGSLPTRLTDLVRSCLDKQPSRRPPSCRAVEETLRAVVAESSALTHCRPVEVGHL